VVMKSIIFWDLTPCSSLSCTRRSSEMSGATQRTTRRHIPEDDTLHGKEKFRLIIMIQIYILEISDSNIC
jgi:hypothetical protein